MKQLIQKDFNLWPATADVLDMTDQYVRSFRSILAIPIAMALASCGYLTEELFNSSIIADKIAPILSINFTPKSFSSKVSEVKVEVNTSDEGGSGVLSIDINFFAGENCEGEAFKSIENSSIVTFDLSLYGGGANSVKARARDRAGNVSNYICKTTENGKGFRPYFEASKTPKVSESIILNNVAYFAISDGKWGTELWKSDGTSNGTQILKDIVEGPYSSFPEKFVIFNNKILFSADDSQNGRELWISDGTTSGTQMLKDIYVGPGSSSPGQFKIVGSTLFFTATTSAEGNELWKTDGTASGTQLVKDINPGSSSSGVNGIDDLAGTAVFIASDTLGSNPWKSDGTSAGTQMILDMVAGANGCCYSNMSYFGFTTEKVYNGYYYFSGVTATFQRFIYRTDGTAVGTTAITGDMGFMGGIYSMSIVNNKLLIAAEINWMSSIELYSWDGSSFSLVKEFNSNMAGWGRPYFYHTDSNYVYMAATSNTSGRDFWRSDGTTLGTTIISDTSPDMPVSQPDPYTQFKSAGGKLYYVRTAAATGYEAYVSDGTPGGTSVIDLKSGASGSLPSLIGDVNGKMLLTANGDSGIGLYVSDGTLGGSTLIKSYGSSSVSNYTGNWSILGTGPNQYFFQAPGSDGLHRLYVDHKTKGVTELAIVDNGSGGSRAGVGAMIGDTLVFPYDSANEGSEIWISDGTVSGTKLIKDIRAGTSASSPQNFATLNQKVFFSADDGVNGRELWSTDGTLSGTNLVSDIEVGASGSSPATIVAFGNAVFFSAWTTASGAWSLWKSDGSSTSLVKQLYAGCAGCSPMNLTVANNKLFFVANSSAPSGTDLWASDGTTATTNIIKNLSSGSTTFVYLRSTASRLYFTYTDATYGTELFVSDGTVGGTSIVKDIYPGTSSSFSASNDFGYGPLDGSGSSTSRFFLLNNMVHFFANDGTSVSLWKTDGTDPGTVIVKSSIAPTGGGTAVLGNKAYFTGTNSGVCELWETDSTSGGTTIITSNYLEPSFTFYCATNTYWGFKILNDKLFNYASEKNSIYGSRLYRFVP